jgi:tetratricopeptide (TPR) repeat protein
VAQKGSEPGLWPKAVMLPVRLSLWWRAVAVAIGFGGLAAGGVAVFVTSLEAGPVALLAVGFLFLIIGMSGRLPTRLKIGDNEAEWLEIKEAEERIKQQVPEVGALLDASGASFDAFLSGQAPEPGPALEDASAKAGSLAHEVRWLESKAGRRLVPPEALLEIGKWYLAQGDWARGTQYLESYVQLVDADWEVYFSLGVADMNMRAGPSSDLRALLAYDHAAALMPAKAPRHLRARLYSYRAAAKKRLGRLEEAKADAELARSLANRDYERMDAIYNLASIEAMLGNSDAALMQLRELVRLGGGYLVNGHLDDYFSSLKDDPEFRILLGLTGA